MKKNKSLIIILLIVVVGLIGLTLAYFTNTASVSNEFKSREYGTTVTEEFTSPENWLPGSTEPKTLTVTNSGHVDEAVRVSYTESWTSRSAKNNEEEGDLPLAQNGNTAALIHFTNTDDWTTVTENGTTYRYYNYKLAPSATTSELLDYVTFNPAITNNSNCTTREENGTKTITCNSTGTGYDDATYKLTFNIETIQYDKYKTAWGTNVNIASMKPMNARELALKSNPISVTNYTDGNVHEMYTFNHEATEQTPALTDYRYIGNDPYNYVYFNCDSLDNQNSDTCEVWRIIGVFDVERPDPNDNTQTITERRIKLVMGSAFAEKMQWNSNGFNSWSTASLKTLLNEDYLNRTGNAIRYGLKSLAQSQISDTKYYLGAHSDYPSGDGTSEQIYNWERGTNLPNIPQYYGISNEISWKGKVALMYPSDMYMVYGKGVSNDCFNNPSSCFNYESYEIYRHPESGWIYNSNNLEGQNSPNFNWFLSSYADDYQRVYLVYESGCFSNSSSVRDTVGVRPVVYLKSSVKIIDGDGSSSNPYKLGF